MVGMQSAKQNFVFYASAIGLLSDYGNAAISVFVLRIGSDVTLTCLPMVKTKVSSKAGRKAVTQWQWALSSCLPACLPGSR